MLQLRVLLKGRMTRSTREALCSKGGGMLQLRDQTVVVCVGADPEPCNTVFVSTDGLVCDPDSD